MRRWPPRAVLAVIVLSVLAATFLLPTSHPSEAPMVRLTALAFGIAGLLATRRREGRTLGWLMLGLGMTEAAIDVLSGYAEAVLPGALWAAWASEWISVMTPALLLIYLPLLFPTGRVVSPGWRWVGRAGQPVVVLAVLQMALYADDPYVTERSGTVLGYNPVGVPALTPLADAAFLVVLGCALVLALAAFASLVVRWRRATGVERLQIRWLGWGIALTLALLLLVAVVGVADLPFSETVIDVVVGTAVLLVPGAVLIAITRYRLYELDRVISRTVSYAAVTGLLIGLYAGAAFVLSPVLAALGGGSELAVAGATLAVAAAFRPVRRRVQATVDRRFNRARYDAQRTVEAFRARLRDEVDLDGLHSALVGVVRATVEPAQATVWLRPAGGAR